METHCYALSHYLAGEWLIPMQECGLREDFQSEKNGKQLLLRFALKRSAPINYWITYATNGDNSKDVESQIPVILWNRDTYTS